METIHESRSKFVTTGRSFLFFGVDFLGDGVNGADKVFHVFWVHIRINAVTQVDHVSLRPETTQHLLGQTGQFVFGSVQGTRVQIA